MADARGPVGPDPTSQSSKRTPGLSCCREVALGLLVPIYIGLSIVVYTDHPMQATDPPLSETERQGLAIWRDHNCQACHQIYGFGGFLGPDLTNRVTERTPDAEFRYILEDGSREMPAFDLPEAEQEAVLAFLRAVNRSGRSQPAPLGARREVNPVRHFQEIVASWQASTGAELTPPARRGLEVWNRFGCGACHAAFTLGTMRAPDLSRSAVDLSVPALRELLEQGRRNMPPFAVPPDQVGDLSAFLAWVSSNRPALVDLNDRLVGREEFSWGNIPWFEYSR